MAAEGGRCLQVLRQCPDVKPLRVVHRPCNVVMRLTPNASWQCSLLKTASKQARTCAVGHCNDSAGIDLQQLCSPAAHVAKALRRSPPPCQPSLSACAL